MNNFYIYKNINKQKFMMQDLKLYSIFDGYKKYG